MFGEKYLEARSQLGTALGSITTLAQEIGSSPETVGHLRNLSQTLNQPFLFVTVGEVKSGKSSLLNALFGRELSRVHVLPATDRIYVFKFGENDRDVPVSEHIVERYRPIEFLKDFNLVDTPGTNTIVANHQEITERYIPVADLIIFVFSVTNPWAASAWDFLRLIGKQWKKNIVFVVQQADLRTADEVVSVVRHLEQTVLQNLGVSVPIFAVSAKNALQARKEGDSRNGSLWAASNFGGLEDWISRTVTDSAERGGKIRSVAATTQVILDQLRSHVQGSLDVLLADQQKLATIRGSLGARKEQSLRHIGGFVREMERAYDACRERGEKLLEEKLTVGQTFRMIFSGGRWEKDFQDQVESDVKTKIQAQIEHALSLIESDLRGVWQDMQERVQAQFGTDARNQVRGAVPQFLSQRESILHRIELTLVEEMSDARVKDQLQNLFGETARWLRVPTGVAAAGGIVTVVAILTHTAILDVTGTIAGLAALTGTLYAVFRRRKTLREYRAKMNEKRAELSEAVENQLRQSVDAFYHEVEQTFAPLVSFCEAESRRYLPFREQLNELDRQLISLKSRLD
jgi:small GTP-binding protein